MTLLSSPLRETEMPLPVPGPSTFAVPLLEDKRTLDYYEKQKWFDDIERRLQVLKRDAAEYAARHGITVEELGSA